MEQYSEWLRESCVLANEVDVAGEFIYAAMEKLDNMDDFEEIGDDFFFLYNLSVGIERIQKALLIIINDVCGEKQLNEYLETIKNHRHSSLHDKINDKIKINISQEQRKLLEMLSDFYNKNRYTRLNFLSYKFEDRDNLKEYAVTYYNVKRYNYFFYPKSPINTDEVKECFGRIIGRLCQKYYDAIERESRKRKLYCDDLRGGSGIHS